MSGRGEALCGRGSGRLGRVLSAMCVAALAHRASARPPRGPGRAAGAAVRTAQRRAPTLESSNILEAVRKRKARRPALKAEVAAGGGEWIEEHPKDTRDDYLSFMRFRAGGGSRVIRFNGPCT